MASSTACSKCHTNYTNDSVDPVAHMNGQGEASWNVAAKPNAGLKFVVNSVTWLDGQKPQVNYFVKDSVTNANLTLGTAAGITSATFTLAKLQDDGTYFSPITSTATGANFTDGDGVLRTPALPSAGRAGSVSTSTGGATNLQQPDGSYTYTFPNALSFGADGARLHTLAIWGTRTLSGYAFRGNGHLDFAPNGSAVTPREVVTDAACNECHGQLTLHGSRTGLKSCLTCHSPQSIDPESGNHVDMASMIHKIHNGHLLANTYFIVGFGQTYYEYNHILMAPSHTGYFEGGGTYAAAHDPGLSRECGLCHQGTQAVNALTKPTRRACGSCHDEVNFATGANHFPPSNIVQNDDTQCGVCHSQTAVETYHSRFYETTQNVDFRNSGQVNPPIPAAGHVFTANLVSLTQSGANLTWTVDFALDGAAFSVNPLPNATTRLSTCAFNLAGPTTDYVFPATGGTAQSCTTVATWTATGTPGRFTYTAANSFFTGKPDGYYNASFEIAIQRIYGDATNYIRKPFSATPNFVLVKNTGGVMTQVADPGELALGARREVVTFDKCNACHVQLGFHSNRTRLGPNYCATCHNPKLDNGTRARARVEDAYTTSATGTELVYLPESVSMNAFIHRIHMGSRLPSVAGAEYAGGTAAAGPYVPEPGSIVYGATRSGFVGVTATTPPEMADFSEFLMPNTMNRCGQCHVDSGATQTWGLPESGTVAPLERTYRVCSPTTVSWDPGVQWCNNTATSGMPTISAVLTAPVKVVTPPMKGVCTSCHDSLATDAHTDMFTINPMTAGATELCADCHGAGKALDSLNVHLRIPF
jgi:OmcA/MtrC family decaheme c-type cytochrome